MLTEFERHAWDRRDSAADHKPEMALKVVLDDPARGKMTKVKHIIVVYVEEGDDGGEVCGAVQAGQLTALAAEGALNRVILMQARAKTS